MNSWNLGIELAIYSISALIKKYKILLVLAIPIIATMFINTEYNLGHLSPYLAHWNPFTEFLKLIFYFAVIFYLYNNFTKKPVSFIDSFKYSLSKLPIIITYVALSILTFLFIGIVRVLYTSSPLSVIIGIGYTLFLLFIPDIMILFSTIESVNIFQAFSHTIRMVRKSLRAILGAYIMILIILLLAMIPALFFSFFSINSGVALGIIFKPLFLIVNVLLYLNYKNKLPAQFKPMH